MPALKKNAPHWMGIVSRGARGEGRGAICSRSGAECGNICTVVVREKERKTIHV